MVIKGKDGITHINIYSKGETNLGMWLSNFAYTPIYIPEDGNFASIEGYWYWLRTKDERLRNLSGFEAKNIGKSLVVDLESEITDDFIEKIKKAIDIKIKSNKSMMNDFRDSDLPFCHYYVYDGNRKDAGYNWIAEHFEDRRKLLKEYYKQKNKNENNRN